MSLAVFASASANHDAASEKNGDLYCRVVLSTPRGRAMPIYAYRCSNCGHAQDVLQKISDPVLTVCPQCGQATYVKQVTAAGFQLKGSGWYVTDFRGDKKPAKDDAGDAAKPADKPAAEKGAEPAPASEAKSGDAAKKAESPASAPAPAASPASTPAAPPPPTGKTGG